LDEDVANCQGESEPKGREPGDLPDIARPRTKERSFASRLPSDLPIVLPAVAGVRFPSPLEELIAKYERGGAFTAYPLLPDSFLPSDAAFYTADFLREARFADRASLVARSEHVARSGINPTTHLLGKLVVSGIVTNVDLIGLIEDADRILRDRTGGRYVPGLGWPRFGCPRAGVLPMFAPPRLHVDGLLPVLAIVPGVFELEWVYFKPAPGEPLAMVPAFNVSLRAACALGTMEPRTLYAKTANSSERDWELNSARIRTEDRSRGVRFDALRFWRWLMKHHLPQ
jgi:hypothetical protein